MTEPITSRIARIPQFNDGRKYSRSNQVLLLQNQECCIVVPDVVRHCAQQYFEEEGLLVFQDDAFFASFAGTFDVVAGEFEEPDEVEEGAMGRPVRWVQLLSLHVEAPGQFSQLEDARRKQHLSSISPPVQLNLVTFSFSCLPYPYLTLSCFDGKKRLEYRVSGSLHAAKHTALFLLLDSASIVPETKRSHLAVAW